MKVFIVRLLLILFFFFEYFGSGKGMIDIFDKSKVRIDFGENNKRRSNKNFYGHSICSASLGELRWKLHKRLLHGMVYASVLIFRLRLCRGNPFRFCWSKEFLIPMNRSAKTACTLISGLQQRQPMIAYLLWCGFMAEAFLQVQGQFLSMMEKQWLERVFYSLQ